jgi:hypothetical protein
MEISTIVTLAVYNDLAKNSNSILNTPLDFEDGAEIRAMSKVCF